MKNISLPLVMIASLATLASCTYSEKTTPTEQTQAPSIITGAVETVSTGDINNTGSMPEMVHQTGAHDSQDVMPVSDSGMVAPTDTITNTGNLASPVVRTRTETVQYDSQSPEGMVLVEFSVTVTDDIITAASATPKTDKTISADLQKKFAEAISTKAVGKKAKDLDLDAVGGASLTTDAFEKFVHGF